MACTIDHLCMDLVVRVLQDFTDAKGLPVPAGLVARIVSIQCNGLKPEASIHWEREGGHAETLQFDLSQRSGPGIGRMKAYFEALDFSQSAHHFPPPPTCIPVAPPLPTPGKAPTPGDSLDADLKHVAALAGAHRFDEATEHLHKVLALPDEHDSTLIQAAEDLCRLALAQVTHPDQMVYQWLKERGIGLWYAWGAGATSGGEGSYRATFIRKAEADFEDAEQRLANIKKQRQ